MKNKIVSFENLIKISKLKRSRNKKIVLCHGVFDLLHIGHIKHLQAAKTFGDILIVTITPDKFVQKGPNRPAFNSQLRLEALQALECIDYVSINKWMTATDTIKLLKPHIYCKGPDYKKKENDVTKKIYDEEKAINSIKGSIKFTSDISYSSSNLLNNFFNIYTDKQKKYLKEISKKLSFKDIKKSMSKLQSIKVLILGETIIDKYVFCETLGKSGKEPMLVLREIKTEEYYGGAVAIANHLSNFCKSINLFTIIGEKKEYQKKIIKNVARNVMLTFFYKDNSPTIVKKRFLDIINNNKILGVYEINDELININHQIKIEKQLKKLKNKIDLIIVSDYGHGFLSKKTAKTVATISNSVALNAQVNAANLGLHTINNYKNLETAVINEMELRQEMKDRNSEIKLLIKKLANKMKIKNFIITRGKNGLIYYDRMKNNYIKCPAFASDIVDKIGAGDAMLSILSLAFKAGLDKHLSLLLGSLAAAQSVESMGNSISVDKDKILKVIQNLIK